MKKLILIILSVILFFSCKNEKVVNDYAIFNGTVSGTDSKMIYFYSEVFNEKFKDSASIDEKGFFSIKFDLNFPKYFKFRIGEENSEVYLSQGDSLSVKIIADNFDETIKYFGTGAEFNNYLASSILIESKFPSQYDFLSLQPSDFIKKTDSLEKILFDYLNTSLPTKTDFKKLEKNKIICKKANLRLIYPQYYSYYNNNQDLSNIPESFYDFEKLIDLNDTTLYISDEMNKYVKTYITNKAENLFDKTDTTLDENVRYSIASIKVVDKYISNNKLREFYSYVFMAEHLKYMGTKDIDTLLFQFKAICKNKEYNNSINEDIKKWEALKPGNIAPNFSFPDIKGKVISLSDFKGKYVYIDIWATWCGPCKAEAPHFEELKKNFKTKNVVFISVSVDDTKEPWEKMVTEKKLSDIQIYAAGWSSSITKDYLINSIPRFLLIDREGKIIDSNAERPSGKIGEILNKLDEI
ncbi:MAG: hypothetical protein A2046_08255 [Bacteroidetes bacterium GWA2_30_7]|nr:MAG: hypothetical protein A2046_08255 [Bacteroidetes bacterium GWA2_30_7]